MEKEELCYAIERIEYMEKMFDDVQSTFKSDRNSVKDETFCKKVSLLTQYMESGQWLRDYQLDEKGELPKELKRGILSEDCLYNLLCDIEQAQKKSHLPFTDFFKKIKSFFK